MGSKLNPLLSQSFSTRWGKNPLIKSPSKGCANGREGRGRGSLHSFPSTNKHTSLNVEGKLVEQQDRKNLT
jgi:hypothetical protein